MNHAHHPSLLLDVAKVFLAVLVGYALLVALFLQAPA